MSEFVRLYRDAEGLPVVETRLRVRFFETDQMRVVHHAAYITWFEEGRGASHVPSAIPMPGWRRRGSHWRWLRFTRALSSARAL